ncbi:MAG: hypothetical protein P1P76_12610, partial [Anaerolineales bacterium]|nr:hypothetical protein [Anaerolineales bacterium]
MTMNQEPFKNTYHSFKKVHRSPSKASATGILGRGAGTVWIVDEIEAAGCQPRMAHALFAKKMMGARTNGIGRPHQGKVRMPDVALKAHRD